MEDFSRKTHFRTIISIAPIKIHILTIHLTSNRNYVKINTNYVNGVNVMPTYNKLVRDRILEIIEAEGLSYNSRILEKDEHLTEIKKKLYEEVKEFDETTNEEDAVEELADILELIHAALKVYNKSFDDLETVRVNKKEKRGGFDKGLYLIDVEDK